MNFSSHICRAIEARVDDVDAIRRTITARINTPAVDRYRTCIPASGMDLRAYRANPVMLWEHGMDKRGALPVGRGDKIWQVVGPNGPELLAQPRWFSRADGKGDEFTDQLFEMYRSGDLKAFSVRVIPGANCGPPTAKEIRARPELADCECMYRSTELAEFSCVAVGGNSECLSLDEARSVLHLVCRGLTLSDRLVSQARVTAGAAAGGLPPLTGRAVPDVRAAILREAAGVLRDAARRASR